MEYQLIDRIVANIDPDLSAAGAHGIASGMLCANHQLQGRAWLDEIFQDGGEISQEDRDLLESWFEETKTVLVEQQFDFDLCLPDDDTPLPLRLEALSNWCQGYLFGIGVGNYQADWPSEMREVIKDIAELAKLDTQAEGEEAENDFMEITEYVRTGVAFINTELNALTNATIH